MARQNLVILLFIIFSLIVYSNSLKNNFIFDDLHTIQNNLYIKDISYIPLFFKGYYSSAPIDKGMFRPLLLLTFSFNYLFSRLQPLGYHIINILLHFLNGVLFYSLLRFLKKDLSLGFILILCLLFIAHPINTQTVNYITCRSDLLLTLFILLGFIAYIRTRPLLTLFFYLLSLLTKETALVFPFLVFGYDFLISKRDSKKIKFYLILIGITAIYWLYRGIIYNFGPKEVILTPFKSPLRDFFSNFLTQSAVTLFYLRLFLFPHPLTIHHNFPSIDNFFSPLGFFSVITLALIVSLIFILRKRQPLISLGLFWYLICLLPKFYAVLNVVAAEHQFYLPSFGIYLTSTILIQPLYLRFRQKFIIIATGIIIIFTILVWFRNYEWRDALTLWKSAVKANSSSEIAHHNLGIEYVNIGKYQEAEEHLKKARSLTNRIDIQSFSRIYLAYIKEKENKFTEAEEILKESLKINPVSYETYRHLGSFYLRIGREDEALEYLQKALEIHPLSSNIHIDLGAFYFKKRRLKEAKEHLQKALRYDPDSDLAYLNLGLVLELESDIEGAIEAYAKSVRLNPTYAISQYLLGKIYAKKSDLRSLHHLKEAIRLDPNLAEAHNELAVLYASMDPPNLGLARQHAQKAVILGYKVEVDFLKTIDFPPNQ